MITGRALELYLTGRGIRSLQFVSSPTEQRPTGVVYFADGNETEQVAVALDEHQDVQTVAAAPISDQSACCWGLSFTARPDPPECQADSPADSPATGAAP